MFARLKATEVPFQNYRKKTYQKNKNKPISETETARFILDRGQSQPHS